ncbi:hypothetical protein EDB86DRAFT_3250392 [Lactarius hatsudake]|nr:hypothetical protein EDB86DRAFT_3250392 [Lactarius hatsudake]
MERGVDRDEKGKERGDGQCNRPGMLRDKGDTRRGDVRPVYEWLGVEILTVPGQASSSEFCGSFGAEMDENGALNEGCDGCVVGDDKGAVCLRLAMAEGDEEDEGSNEGDEKKARAKEAYMAEQFRVQIRGGTRRKRQQTMKGRNGDDGEKGQCGGAVEGPEMGTKEGTRRKRRRCGGRASDKGGEGFDSVNAHGGGCRDVRYGQKVIRGGGEGSGSGSNGGDEWEETRGMGVESARIGVRQIGCVEGVGGELLRGVETCKAIGVSLGGRSGESKGGGWDEMGRSSKASSLASSGGDIGPAVMSHVASSRLGEGGVMGPFGESLSSPGGVRMGEVIDEGGCSGELGLMLNVGAEANLSSGLPSTRDSVAGGGSAGGTDTISGTSPAFGYADKKGEGGLSKTADETEDAAGMNVSSELSSVAEGASEGVDGREGNKEGK